jgi:hypothetical protein
MARLSAVLALNSFLKGPVKTQQAQVAAMSSYFIVPTSDGNVRGKLAKTKATNSSYLAFYKIPFAKPPIGNLRSIAFLFKRLGIRQSPLKALKFCYDIIFKLKLL